MVKNGTLLASEAAALDRDHRSSAVAAEIRVWGKPKKPLDQVRTQRDGVSQRYGGG
jgi:hypothetical protein